MSVETVKEESQTVVGAENRAKDMLEQVEQQIAETTQTLQQLQDRRNILRTVMGFDITEVGEIEVPVNPRTETLLNQLPKLGQQSGNEGGAPPGPTAKPFADLTITQCILEIISDGRKQYPISEVVAAMKQGGYVGNPDEAAFRQSVSSQLSTLAKAKKIKRVGNGVYSTV